MTASWTPVPTPSDSPLSRRNLLKGSAAAALAFGGPLSAYAVRAPSRPRPPSRPPAGCQAGTASVLLDSPYGATAPVLDQTTGLPLVELPAGFSCKSFGWRGDPMSDGLPTPGSPDGMGVALARRVGLTNELILVRNHELTTSSSPERILGAGRDNVPKWDTGSTGGRFATGGTTHLVWRDGEWAESWASLGGIVSPCAGGSSNWGSWLSNEERLSNAVSSTGRRHGWVFEVPADTSLQAADPNPIVDMGRMAHEASALDPATGFWYLTEDQADASALYRFRPHNLSGGLGSLHAGGRLQGLAVRGLPRADLRFPTLCQEYQTEWVDIADPGADGLTLASVVTGGAVAASGPFAQAYANGVATFGGNEGCWVSLGRVYFTDKAIGSQPPRAGRVWMLDLQSMVLKAIFVSNDRVVGSSPDNICISPRGGLLFCEDGGDFGASAPPTSAPVLAQHLKGLAPNGNSWIFARSNYQFTRAQLDAVGKTGALEGDLRHTEWAGAVFSPDGQVLFVNLYCGVTLAITGPWERGPL